MEVTRGLVQSSLVWSGKLELKVSYTLEKLGDFSGETFVVFLQLSLLEQSFTLKGYEMDTGGTIVAADIFWVCLRIETVIEVLLILLL